MKASGRAPAKTAVHKHEKAMHKGKPLTKLAKGGKLNIKAAIGKPGALHAQLGVPQGKKIPAGKLAKAAKAPGKLGQRARFAETLKGFKKGKSKFADGGSVSNFGAAFRAARKSGADDFTWNGKKYTTETRDEQNTKAGPRSASMSISGVSGSSSDTKPSAPPPKPAPPPPPAKGSQEDYNAKAKNRSDAIVSTVKDVGRAFTGSSDKGTPAKDDYDTKAKNRSAAIVSAVKDVGRSFTGDGPGMRKGGKVKAKARGKKKYI